MKLSALQTKNFHYAQGAWFCRGPQHICAHCFGPHSFDMCGAYSESRSAYLKNRLDTVKRRFGSSAITSHAFRKKRHVGLPTCRTVLDANTSMLSKVESPCSSLKNVPVDRVGAVQGGVGLLTPPKVSCSASRIQQVPGPGMESGVDIPTPLLQESAKHASSPVCIEVLTLPQPPQISVSPQNPVSVAFSRDFTRNSKKCSPVQLTVSELHKKTTGFLATLSRDTSEIPVWAGRTLKVLSCSLVKNTHQSFTKELRFFVGPLL